MVVQSVTQKKMGERPSDSENHSHLRYDTVVPVTVLSQLQASTMRPRAAGQSLTVTAAADDFNATCGYQHIFLKKTLGVAGIFACLTLRRLLIPAPVSFVQGQREKEGTLPNYLLLNVAGYI